MEEELKGKEFEYVKGINTKKDSVQIKYCIDKEDVIQAFSKLKKENLELKTIKHGYNILNREHTKLQNLLSKRAKEAQQSIALKDEQIKKVFDDMFELFTVKQSLELSKTGLDGDVRLSEVAKKCVELKKKHLHKK